MTDFYLPRHDQQALLEQLRQVSALVEDLTIAVTRQDRITARGPMTSRGDDVQPLPFNEHASKAAQFLYFTLANWTAFTCQQRGIDFDGRDNAISCAAWLRRHIIDLALCEGSEDAYTSIRDAIRNGNKACNGAPDRIFRHHDHDVARARYSLLHADGLAKAARELGPEYRGLTVRRVYTLAGAAKITPDRVIVLDGTETALYMLGDVLDAHLAYPSRSKRKVPA